MFIKEAIQLLKQGKKIRHASMAKDDFIKLDEKEKEVKYYYLRSNHFLLDTEILLSSGWHEKDKQDQDLFFEDALDLMMQGKRLCHESNEDGFYEFDQLSQTIIKKKYEPTKFSIEHQTLLSNEWVEVK